MIEIGRKQLSFGDGLIAEEVSDLRESWISCRGRHWPAADRKRDGHAPTRVMGLRSAICSTISRDGAFAFGATLSYKEPAN
jgi:hypothetical protein